MKKIQLDMTFDDLRRRGKSIGGTEEHINLTMGSLHSGSTFPGAIYLDDDSALDFQDMLAAGLQVTFWVTERTDSNDHPSTFNLQPSKR